MFFLLKCDVEFQNGDNGNGQKKQEGKGCGERET